MKKSIWIALVAFSFLGASLLFAHEGHAPVAEVKSVSWGFEGLKALPNVHPIVVHFPIAFLPLAFLFYLCGVTLKKETYRGYLHRISKQVLGRKINPHDFRHSLITQLKALRVPNKDIMQITGHMDERVLNDHYSHSTEEGRMEALKLSGI